MNAPRYLSLEGERRFTRGPALREVCFLVGEDDTVLWSDASQSPVRLPDSRHRWDAIWSRRARIVEIVHSHPVGPLAFSWEDETTMRALVTALGRAVLFSVVAPRGMVRRNELVTPVSAPMEVVVAEPWWAGLLRLASGMHDETAPALHPNPPTRSRDHEREPP